VGTITFANQAKGAFLDSLTISMVHLPLAGEGKQYVVWLSDRTHAPLNLGKLLVRADGSARLTYADPKGANLLATYSVAYIISQSSATPTAQDPVVFSGALPPLASVHVQHVLTQFPDTPGNVGLMIGALQQAEVLTEHANLLATALKQNDVTLTKAHMEHIYNILTGKEGAKDINGDGILTISPPGDGYGLLNYLTNAVEHATLAVQQPDATDSMKLAAKRLGTAVANITANYVKIQTLLEQASTKKAMVEIKPLMERVIALNNIVMNGTAAGTTTPDPDSAQFDGLLNAFDQAAALGAINFFPGDAALKIAGTAAVQTTIQAAGALTFANQAKGAFFDALTMNLTHMPMAVGVQQYIAWLSDLSHAPLKLGKLQVNTDGTAQLTYADPKGANLLAQYSVAYVTIQAGDNATAQDPVVFSGALPPLAGVHVQHVLTQFPDTPGNVGLMIGALQQAEVLTEHANLLAVALKQNDVTLTKAHMEHIYNILTGKEGAKDINGDGILTISPPGDGYGLLNYLTNAVEHATLAVQQPDATDAMKLTAKRLGTAVANITANYIKIQTLLEQASTKKAMAEIKPLMERVIALNNTAMNGAAAGNATPDPDSAKFDGLLNAFNQAASLGTIVLFPGDAALKTATAPGAATTSNPGGTVVPTMAGMSMAAPTVVTVQPLRTNTPTAIPANTVVIQLQGETFVPGTITVKVGTLIVFSNQSTEQHTATADDGSFATGVLQPGTESKPFLMSKPGTYAYFCEFHGGAGHVGMSGVIIVQ
jgi:plastocyanin